MASMTTILESYQTIGDMKTWSLPAHTALDPFLAIQQRKAPSNPNANLESTFAVVKQTRNAEGAVLPSRVMLEAKVKFPKLGAAADVTSCITVFRDFVASDEFVAMVNEQRWASA